MVALHVLAEEAAGGTQPLVRPGCRPAGSAPQTEIGSAEGTTDMRACVPTRVSGHPQAHNSAAALVHALMAAGRDVAAGFQLPTSAAVLAATLSVTKQLVQREDGAHVLCGGADVVTLLQGAGLVKQLLAMLVALGPPVSPRRPQESVVGSCTGRG